MKPAVVAIIQARMASSRLPGKVLLDIGVQPMLGRVFERAKRARTVQHALVATTADPSDDPVERFCQAQGYPYYRGSPQDVLDRYYQAARLVGAGIIVRITADCPVIDPDLIDDAVTALLGGESPGGQWSALPANKQADSVQPESDLPTSYPAGHGNLQPSTFPSSTVYDFVANRLPPPWGRTYPIGLDVEVCTFAALETAWKEARLPHQREHVMPFFYDNPERFRIHLLNHTSDLSAYRWTVDTSEDLELMRRVYAYFKGRDDFSWLEVLALFEGHPELGQINAGVRHKDYREFDQR